VQLLLEEGFHALRAATEERFLEFRREYYQEKKAAGALAKRRWV